MIMCYHKWCHVFLLNLINTFKTSRLVLKLTQQPVTANLSGINTNVRSYYSLSNINKSVRQEIKKRNVFFKRDLGIFIQPFVHSLSFHPRKVDQQKTPSEQLVRHHSENEQRRHTIMSFYSRTKKNSKSMLINHKLDKMMSDHSSARDKVAQGLRAAYYYFKVWWPKNKDDTLEVELQSQQVPQGVRQSTLYPVLTGLNLVIGRIAF